MHKNYKGVYKDTAPIYYEGGAHFKYNDLVNKLYQLQNNNNNNIEENENNNNEENSHENLENQLDQQLELNENEKIADAA